MEKILSDEEFTTIELYDLNIDSNGNEHEGRVSGNRRKDVATLSANTGK